MSVTKIISSYLPYLRRYARAITGSQQNGDAAVIALLESVANDRSIVDSSRDPRVFLYQLLLDIINGPVGDHLMSLRGMEAAQDASERTLKQISPLSRQAFLLVTMEGFSEEDASRILSVPMSVLETILAVAQDEIATQVLTDVLIIEDEVFIARDIEKIVTALGHRISARARTHKEAVAAIRAQKPGLVLADINLADGSSGIDAVNEILEVHQVPVVFITAYPERLLTGLRPEPTFLISKPFSAHEIRGVISQVLFFNSRAQPGTSCNQRQKSPIVSSAVMMRAR